jgi:hypothetical protein
LSEHDDGLEVWAVADQLGRSFYSSSMPANFAERSFANGAFAGTARATSMTGDGTPSATSSGLRSPMSDDGTTTTTSTSVSAAAAATGTAAGVSVAFSSSSLKTRFVKCIHTMNGTVVFFFELHTIDC